MGNVRPTYIKKISRELVEKYGDRFSSNFEENKKALEKMTNINSKAVRNRIAGYITKCWIRNENRKSD